MKRTLAFLTAICLLLCFGGCSKKAQSQETPKTVKEVEEYAIKGQMPESEYKLGDDIATIKSELDKIALEDSESGQYFEGRGDSFNYLQSASFAYYYLKNSKNPTLSCLVSFEKAYTFNVGDLIIEVEQGLSDYGFTEENFNDTNSFYIFGAQDGTILKKEFGEYTVSFAFIDNALAATAIYITNDWK